MAGTVVGNALQLGDSATASQNFTLRTNVDGTASLVRGNGQVILNVDAAGNVRAPATVGSIIKKTLATDAGVTIGSTVITTAMATGPVVFTPLSTNSKILVSVSLTCQGAYAAAANILSFLRLFEGSTATVIGALASFNNNNAGGGNLLALPVVLQAVVNNASLTPRSFGLAGYYTGAAAQGLGLTNQVWEITEVQA